MGNSYKVTPEATKMTEYFLEVIKDRINKGDTLDNAVRDCLPVLLNMSGHFNDKTSTTAKDKKESLRKGSGKIYTFRGVTGNLAYLCKHFDINYGSVRGSISHYKWSVEQSLTHYYNLKLKRENK